MSADPFDSALDLLRRLNPKHTADHLNSILQLAPDLTEDLLSSVDQPLTVRRCKQTGRDYLLCDYNREGAGEGAVPGERVRKLEVLANEAFDVYRDLYYEGGVSSVYLWNLDDGFAGVVLLKKSSTPAATTGVWDSIHVFEALDRGRTTNYRLTSTVILSLAADGLDLSGNLTRQLEQDLPVLAGDASHLANIGRLVEDMESKMRNQLQEVYFGKAQDVVGDLRSVGSRAADQRDRAAQREALSGVKRRN
ncbi:snf2 family helicase [Niveomyces insectorum RCEF 264]|uniref:F-actin-capping protein subunit beta n=1 Tax=Niveomyces insectorum RCEF 264 TaxID=1081102 RepID=A0A167TVU7_9HYPO|nr:snf2 family helicase [Niveomyces insectorum RCEF 264]